MKNARRVITENFTEIWLGLLLFVGLPLVAGLYLDWRAALGVSFLFQSIILILFVRKDK